MPYRFLPAVEPIVAHGLREMSLEGANLEHTLREVALMAALVGAGIPPAQAISQVEAMERQLLGMPPGERYEPEHAMPGPYGKPYGKGMPYGQGKMPYGKPMGQKPYGKPMGQKPYGKGQRPTMPYGKPMMPFGPYGMPMSPGMGAGPYMDGEE